MSRAIQLTSQPQLKRTSLPLAGTIAAGFRRPALRLDLAVTPARPAASLSVVMAGPLRGQPDGSVPRIEMKLTVLERRRSTHSMECEPKQKRIGLSHTHRRDLRRLGGILAALLRLENGFDIASGDLLLELHEYRSAWALLGVTGLEEYADRYLGVGRSTARRRVSLARSLRRLHVVRAAYESGEIGFTAAVWVASGLRHVAADGAVQRRWIEHAKRTTHKRQRDEERHRVHEELQGMIAVAQEFTPGASGKAAVGRAPGGRAADGPAPVDGPRSSGNSTSGTSVAKLAQTARFSPQPASPSGQPSPMTDEAWHASLRRVPGSIRNDVLSIGCTLLERVLRREPVRHQLRQAGDGLRVDLGGVHVGQAAVEAGQRRNPFGHHATRHGSGFGAVPP